MSTYPFTHLYSFPHGAAVTSRRNNFFTRSGKVVPMDEGKFNRLSLNERINIVWRQGEFVDSVIYNNYCLMLYSVNRQFIEMFIDLKSHNIVWISMANEYDLAKYLDGIQLEV